MAHQKTPPIFCVSLVLITLMPILTHAASISWTNEETRAYSRRNFIELEQLMIEGHQATLIKAISRQETDLKGCRALHRGLGGIIELIECMRFVNREKELNLKSSGVKNMIKDLTLLCHKLVKTESEVRQLAESHVLFAPNGIWRTCAARAWRQVYLTAAARFDAEPVAVLAYVRTAEAGLPSQCSWATKSMKLIQESKLAQRLK